MRRPLHRCMLGQVPRNAITTLCNVAVGGKQTMMAGPETMNYCQLNHLSIADCVIDVAAPFWVTFVPIIEPRIFPNDSGGARVKVRGAM